MGLSQRYVHGFVCLKKLLGKDKALNPQDSVTVSSGYGIMLPLIDGRAVPQEEDRAGQGKTRQLIRCGQDQESKDTGSYPNPALDFLGNLRRIILPL